jgi:hypothetical protein
MTYARLLSAVLVSILVLPHPRSFAQFFPVLPDLTVNLVEGTSWSCAGPSLLRLFITFQLRNIGKGAAVSPGPFHQWVVIRDTGGGPSVPEPMWSTGAPAQISSGQILTYKAQPLMRQVPVFKGGVPVGFPKRYDVLFVITADPLKSILETNKLNNGLGSAIQLNNKPKGFPPDFNPARCK